MALLILPRILGGKTAQTASVKARDLRLSGKAEKNPTKEFQIVETALCKCLHLGRACSLDRQLDLVHASYQQVVPQLKHRGLSY